MPTFDKLRDNDVACRQFWNDALVQFSREYADWKRRVDMAYRAFDADELRRLKGELKSFKEELGLITMSLAECR